MNRSLDQELLAARPPKNRVDPWRPYAFTVEDERSAEGVIEPVATLFLTNRECPFRCVMCDLWKNTTDDTVPIGAIPAQIDWALERLAPAPHIKLYNSGNFFDRRAIPVEDHAAIARRVASFRTVIVENHPRLCGDGCLRFRDLLPDTTTLEIALGLETVHPEILPRLNKQMTLDQFATAASFLRSGGIELRAFVLLRPPGLNDDEGIDWAVRSVRFALEQGVRVTAIIPVRPGNGLLEQWQSDGRFSPPTLRSLEAALDRAVHGTLDGSLDGSLDGALDGVSNRASNDALAAEPLDGRPSLRRRPPRIFADLWDVERLATCPVCAAARRDRLARTNHLQVPQPPVACSSCEK